MALIHSTAARNAAADAVLALINGGAGDATGDLSFAKSDNTVLVTLTFSATAFGAASAGVATAATITSGAVGAAITSQTISQAFLRNKANVTVLTCAVATSASDINLSSVVVSTGDTVAVSSLTYTAPT